MKKTVYADEFVKLFDDYGRSANFTRKARYKLFDYLTELEEESGVEYTLDVIGLCCYYAEYASLEEFQNDYGMEYQTIADIEEKTVVIMIDDKSFIVESF